MKVMTLCQISNTSTMIELETIKYKQGLLGGQGGRDKRSGEADVKV